MADGGNEQVDESAEVHSPERLPKASRTKLDRVRRLLVQLSLPAGLIVWQISDNPGGAALGIAIIILPILAVLEFYSTASREQSETYEQLHDDENRVVVDRLTAGGDVYIGYGFDSETRTEGADVVQSVEELRMDFLWNQAQNRLNAYHRLASSQSQFSFVMLMSVATAAFGIIGVVAWQAADARTTGGAVAGGAVGAVVGALAAYVNRTFQRIHREATSRLSAYFAQPLLLTRLLAAERLLQRLDGDAADEGAILIIKASLAVPDLGDQADLRTKRGSPGVDGQKTESSPEL